MGSPQHRPPALSWPACAGSPKELAPSGLDPGRASVKEFMITPPATIRPDTSEGDAFATMIGHYFRHVSVVDPAGEPLSILSIRNLLEA